jgi:hypothetical protein
MLKTGRNPYNHVYFTNHERDVDNYADTTIEDHAYKQKLDGGYEQVQIFVMC